MSEMSSYWLPDGKIIFPYDTQNAHYPPWVIGAREKRGEKTEISHYRSPEFGRYITEKQARKALNAYAVKNGLTPAY